jgi:hypothetical protein
MSDTATHTDDRIPAYARAMFDVARAEGNAARIGDELFRFARALEGSDELAGGAHRRAPAAQPAPADRRGPARRPGGGDDGLPRQHGRRGGPRS